MRPIRRTTMGGDLIAVISGIIHAENVETDLKSDEGTQMTIEEKLLQALRDLPPEKREQVLSYAESLKAGNGPKRPRRSLRGLWADLGVEITEKDIAEARREMWGNFPRDIT